MENNEIVQPVDDTAVAAAEVQIEQTEVADTPATFKPNKKQTTVAVLLVVAGVLGVLRTSLANLIPYGDLSALLLGCMPFVLYLLGWLMLSFMAVNKAVKVGAAIGVGVHALNVVFSAIPSLNMNEFAVVMYLILTLLGICYCVSLIQNNGGVQGRSKAWINLFALDYVFSFSVFFYNFLFMQEWIDQYEGIFYPVLQHVFSLSTYFTIWNLILMVLMIFAYWNLARCEAFSGKYDAEAVPNFSPLNKWMAMAVIVPVVIVVALAVIYSNCMWFI